MTTTTRSRCFSLALLLSLSCPAVASAHEARPPAAPRPASSAWSEPVPALGGVPLAVYVARHQDRRLHVPGV